MNRCNITQRVSRFFRDAASLATITRVSERLTSIRHILCAHRRTTTDSNSGNWRSIAAAYVIAAPLLATDVKTVPIELTTSKSKSPTQWDGPKFTLAIALIIGIVLFAAAMWYLPHPIVLPLLSVAAIGGAIIVALIAWLSTRKETAEALSYWDVVGAMTMIGVCAALLSDPEQAIPLLEQRQNK